MKTILILLGSVTVLQLAVCHMSLWWLIVVVDRLLFCTRRIGAVIPVRKLFTAEGVSIALMLLFHMIFSKEEVPWLRILLHIIFDLFACGIMLYDSVSAVYETVYIDEEDI